MSSNLLASVQTEYGKLYRNIESDDGNRRISHLKKCIEDTNEFRTQLKKLRAHLNKHIQEVESGNSHEKSQKKKELILEKLNKNHKHWDHSIKKSYRSQQAALTGYHKNFLNKLSKIDIDQVYLNKLPEDADTYVKQAIGYHISRYHMKNLPAMETKYDMLSYLKSLYGINPKISEQFIDMGEIIQSIQTENTQKCMAWLNSVYERGVHDNFHTSEDDNSLDDLKFELHILEFFKILRKNDPETTLKFVSHNIPSDTFEVRPDKVLEKVSPLLTRSILGEKIEGLTETLQAQVDKCISLFTVEFCKYLNLPHHSPLFLVVLSGIISFQFFIKYKNIRTMAHVGWTTEDELPFDVQLPDFLSRFHPIFICPVLKEETTVSNPPYSLACHHIISKKALDRLSKNGSLTFKCPYCPVNTSMASTRKVNFIMV
ncbi:E3 ubiquitin-protein ligase RMD5 [Nakaseomyces bracarensis]|uniref:E3 ubiquitin-protein ligase RMD5 n=1 Tax=Nakaseomyces bracarensis TaxID=273131 RepID=A0ABR4NXQ2_9SACH